MSKKEFRGKSLQGDRFVSRIVSESKTYLWGPVMTLENLLGMGSLKEHPVDAAEIRKLLNAAQRNLNDSRVQAVSPEARFPRWVSVPCGSCAWMAVPEYAIYFQICVTEVSAETRYVK
jgi:hypothetical protein